MAPPSDSPEARLECGEVLTFAPCPFPLPHGEDRKLLLRQRLRGPFDKNISYRPDNGQVSGFLLESAEQSERLRQVLSSFSTQAAGWLATLLPGYAARWRPDQATFRPEEEATRRLRTTARNDLLHLDAFPSRPTHGRRILRLFINIHPVDPRVWVTSDTFDKLLDRYGHLAGLPGSGAGDWLQSLRGGLLRFLKPREIQRSPYDQFMLRFHHFLKLHEPFQERGVKKVWRFPPGSAWLLFTDMVSHGELRGQYALEHSFFIAPESLVLPDMAPQALLARKCMLQGRYAA